MSRDPASEPAPYTVPTRIALLSIVGFWLFYYVSVTLRAWIIASPDYHYAMLDNRAWVALFGVGVTYLLYLALQRFSRRSLRMRIAAAFLFAAVGACAYSAVNFVSFYVYDPLPPELERAKERQSMAKEAKDPTTVIVENAIHWYFFMLAWTVFYLALSYAGAIRQSEREAARLRAAAQTAELRALRYQVNPHFLFNTLNSLSALVMSGKREDAEAMILNLSTFFRTSLAAEPTEDVPLSEEVAVQQLYLAIEAVRFPERLRTVFDIDPAAATACVPGLLLQPLIENAVKYGVAPARRPVEVHVMAVIDDGMLVLRVHDDGDGAPAATGTGVGLRNVRDRLAARFGDAAHLNAGPDLDGGFAATIALPLVTHGC